MNPLKPFMYGLALSLFGTAIIRLFAATILRPDSPGRTAALFALSFALMAGLTPRICRSLANDPAQWFEATALLMLPTLLLDPWACVFFARVYPNLQPAAAGLFGGWMLIFCAGSVVGALLGVHRLPAGS
jgi:hypothetical protein